MLSKELLATYLNDHLAGATAGGELAQKISADHSGTQLGVFLAELASDIEQDRAALEDVMTRLGIEKNPIKTAAGWIFEKFSRVKLSDALTGSADLKHLLEFETMSLGIEGKLVMWRALQQVSDEDTELATTDLDALAKRAEGQRAALEEYRLQAAKAALTG